MEGDVLVAVPESYSASIVGTHFVPSFEKLLVKLSFENIVLTV